MIGLHVVDEPPDGAADDRQAALVVIVHGTLDRSTTFGRTARRLRKDGFHVVRYDRRGYGRSVEAGPGGVEEHVADLLEVLDGRRAIVLGHSLGGVVGLAAAARRPELVSAVVAYEPPMPWADWWPGITAGSAAVRSGDDDRSAGDAAEIFMRRMVGDHRWERLPPSTRAARRNEGPAMMAELASLRDGSGPPFSMAAIDRPVVAGCGSESAPHHRRAAEELASGVRRGTLAVVDGASHGVHLTHPAELAELVCQVARGDRDGP